MFLHCDTCQVHGFFSADGTFTFKEAFFITIAIQSP
jgi:hypothetical protein